MKLTDKKAEVHRIQKHYQGHLFSFVSEDVTLPNGSRTEMAMVRHPGSTAVVPLFDDNTVVMELQYRHAVGEYLLEIPAVKVNAVDTVGAGDMFAGAFLYGLSQGWKKRPDLRRRV